jgi:addiction module HigA family antidote
MGKKNTAQPVNPFHPGEVLNEFVRGKRGVTADAALDLGEALGTSARLWMNPQSTWDLSQAERRRTAV